MAAANQLCPEKINNRSFYAIKKPTPSSKVHEETRARKYSAARKPASINPREKVTQKSNHHMSHRTTLIV